MKVSVLIPTYGRKEELIATLRALQNQTVQADEIVVVDQNRPSIPEVDRLCAELPRIKHVHAPSPGVSVNYNRCLEHATGDIILYLDDDIIPDSRLIEMHLENYQKDPELGGVAGRVEQPSGDPDPERIRVVGRYHAWKGTITAHFNSLKPCDVDIAPGGNMSFRRSVLQSVGGFDRGFDGNGYFFETDGSLRVSRSGFRMIFEPRATLKHLMAPAGGARIRDKAEHTYYFVKNGIRLYRRHSPSLIVPVLALRSLFHVLAKSAYNRDLRILRRGLCAVRDGWTQSMEIQR